jgi:hypothetical protein
MMAHSLLRHDRRMTATGLFLAIVVFAYALVAMERVTSAAAPLQPPSVSLVRQLPVGSWLVTYNVPAFVVPIPILLSFGIEGVVMETDSPAPTPVGSLGVLVLSNGHGAWVPTGGGEFAYLYRKLIYQQDGLTPFGTTKTQATGTLSANGTQFQATLLIEFLDTSGNVVLSAPGTATGTRIRVE